MSDERRIIPLDLDPEDKSPKSLTDKEINKAFKLIFERKNDGTIDDEDVRFIVARRAYLTDEQLKHITGKTFDELEESSEIVAPEETDEDEETLVVSKMTGKQIDEYVAEHDIDLGDAKSVAEKQEALTEVLNA